VVATGGWWQADAALKGRSETGRYAASCLRLFLIPAFLAYYPFMQK